MWFFETSRKITGFVKKAYRIYVEVKLVDQDKPFTTLVVKHVWRS